MLNIHVGETIEPLANLLAAQLGAPSDDPFAPEFVAVPTGGMNRWIRLHLARHLGSDGDRGDGVAANIEFVFPGSIRSRLMDAASDTPGQDPWALERLTWVVLDLIKDRANAPMLGPLANLPAGATWYARARAAADLLDRYNTHRPDMIAQWTAGNDTDGAGEPLAGSQLWQPNLWRLTHDCIDAPSPAERLLAILNNPVAHTETILSALPPRLHVFGSSTVPGGSVFLRLAQAISEVLDLDLYLLAPSVTNPEGDHPLLSTWGRPAQETHLLLKESGVPINLVPSPETPAPSTLLDHLRDNIRAGRTIADDPTGSPLPPDDSLVIHSCFGAIRQLEACRDSILGALADDPTLDESDIVVLVPDLVAMAPLIPGVFGPPARHRDRSVAPTVPPIDYQITDRSLELPQEFASGLLATLELLAGRFTRTDLLEFLRRPAVRQRHQFDSSDLTTIEAWSHETGVRWGLNPEHRSRWGISDAFAANTWRHSLDQLLMGVAISDDDPTLATEGLAVHGVEGSSVSLLGRLARLVSLLEDISSQASRSHTVAEWVAWAKHIADSVIEPLPDEEWQADKVIASLNRLLDDSTLLDSTALNDSTLLNETTLRNESTLLDDSTLSPGSGPGAKLELNEFTQLLTSALAPSPGRNRFYSGGVTITSMAPMRWLPSRVTIVVGLDESVFTVAHRSGDDLVEANPIRGDLDRRNELRQSLLETVLSTSDKLIITRTGFSQKNNSEIPAPVTLAELEDVLSQMTGGRFAELVHARQVFDPRHLDPARPQLATFDRSAMTSAAAKANRNTVDTNPVALPPIESPLITVAELRTLLRVASRVFLNERLSARFISPDDQADDNLPVDLDGLETWKLGDNSLASGLAATDWARYQIGTGALPPGLRGQLKSDTITTTTAEITQAAAAKRGGSELSDLAIDLDLGVGRIIGLVGSLSENGLVQTSYSKLKPKAVLRLWLDLMLVTAQDPTRPSTATLVCRPKSKTKKAPIGIITLAALGQDQAMRALIDLVDLYGLALSRPVPLFGDTSYALARGNDAKDYWKAFGGSGDSTDVHNAQVWPSRTLDQLREVATIEGDPGHPSPSRFDAYAERLWGIVDSSLTEVVHVR